MTTDLFDRIIKDKGPLGKWADMAEGYYVFPKLEGPISNRMYFNGKKVVTWSINDYLGLANHPEVLKVDGDARDGCVQYINPNFLLQNIWQLQRYKGEDLIKERFSRGLPILEIDAFNILGMGHTGCNIWSGGIKLNGDKIVIMLGPMSNAQCGWADFERDYVSTIGQQWRIVYLGDKMELWKEGKAVFEFEKLEEGAVIDVTDTEDVNKVYVN